MRNTFILIIQGFFIFTLHAENDTSKVELIFRLCHNHRNIEIPLLDQDLDIFFHLKKDTLVCNLIPVIKIISNGGATIEEGMRITLFKKRKEYIQSLNIPILDMSSVNFIILNYKDYRYVFKKSSTHTHIFEMIFFKDFNRRIK